MSEVLNVSCSGYYAWRNRCPSARTRRDALLTPHIKAAHEATRHTYGVGRLPSELIANGVAISAYKVKVMRQRWGLYCKQKQRYKCTTNSQHDTVVAPNRLGQDFTASRPNQVWVSDITYIGTQTGWLYMAGIKDLLSCEMVGYAIGERMTAGLCLAALQMAQLRRQPQAGLILHSDRGSQYCAKAYQQCLAQAGMLASMSRRGNCYANAPMESFWGSLKNELIHQTHYKTREEARNASVEYVEVFYHRIRRHTKLGNISPAEALRNFKTMQEELA